MTFFLSLFVVACVAQPAKQDINTVKQQWQQKGITDYRIRLRMTYPSSPDIGGDLIITVRNGLNVGYECVASSCALFGVGMSNKYNLTADDLFYMAQYNIMQTTGARNEPVDCLHVEFNAEYSLPQKIDSTNCVNPNVRGLQKAGLIELISFETLEQSSLPKPTKIAMPLDWDNQWLKGIPCKPPCWEGITPGVTTITEASETLRNSSLISTIQLRSDVDSGWGVIEWNWITGGGGGSAGFKPQDANHVIVDIRPNIGQVPLRDVIAAFGEPQYVIASALRNPHGDGVSYALLIIYMPQGILLSNYSLAKPVLSDEAQFDLSFFEPTEDTLSEEIGGMVNFPKWRVSWQGIHNFDFYCKDLEDGAVCNSK